MKIQIFNRLIRHGESFRAPRSVQESIPVRKIYRDGVWLCGGRDVYKRQVWTYVAEMIFNMMVLVGLVKGSDRIVREMMGL